MAVSGHCTSKAATFHQGPTLKGWRGYPLQYRPETAPESACLGCEDRGSDPAPRTPGYLLGSSLGTRRPENRAGRRTLGMLQLEVVLGSQRVPAGAHMHPRGSRWP